MSKFSDKFSLMRNLSEEQIQKRSAGLIALLKAVIEKEAKHVEGYVDHLRELNDGIGREQLARKIISRRSLKAGGVGTVCSLGGFLTMPITMPSDMYLTFRIQARMVLAIAYIYGWDMHDSDTETDILLVMGGNAGVNALKNAGMKIGQEYTKKAIQKYVTREVMKKINRVISRKIITKAGEKSLASFAKLIPVVGAPIGGGVNFIGTQGVGRTALKFYRG